MNWQKEVGEIARRKALAMRMGGRQNVDRHHKAGKLTARERIDLLVDEDSFREHGALTGHAVYDKKEVREIIRCKY